MQRGAKQIKFSKKPSQRRDARERQHEDCHASGEQGRTRSEARKVREIIAASFALHYANNAKRADERDRINGGVEQGRRKSCAVTGDEPNQCVTSVCDRGVGEQSAYTRLRQRDEIPNYDR